MATQQESLVLDLALRVSNWTKGLLDATKSTEQFTKEVNDATKTTEKMKEAIDKTAKENAKASDDYVKQTERMRDAQGRFVKQTEQEIEKAKKKKKELADATKNAAKSYEDLKNAVLAVGSAVGGYSFFSEAVNQAREFDKAIREIYTIVPEGTKTIQQLKKEVSDIALKLGEDGPKAAKAFYTALSSGVEVDKAKAFLESASNLAIGGVTTLDESVNLLTSTLNSYGLSVDKASAVSDSFFKTTELGKITVEEFNQVIGRIAPIAAGAGVSLTQANAAIAALTAGGLTSGQAATGLTQTIQGIIKPSAEAKAAAQELGLEFSATALKSKDLKVFLDEVQTATKGDVDALARLFPSIDSLSAVMALTGKQAQTFAKDIIDIGNAGGASESAMKKVADGFDFQFKRISSAIKAGSTSFGEFLVEMTIGTSKTGNNIEVTQLQIKAFFKQIEVGVGFVINLFKRAVIGIKDLGQEAVDTAIFVKEIFEKGFTRAADNLRIASNRRDAEMRRGLAEIERGQKLIENSAAEANKLYGEAVAKQKELAAATKETARAQKDITNELRSEADIFAQNEALRKLQDKQTADSAFGNRSRSFLEESIGRISGAGLRSSQAQSLIDFVQSSLEKATSEADLRETGIRLQQKLDDMLRTTTDNAFEDVKPEIERTSRRTFEEGVGDGIRNSSPEITRAAEQTFSVAIGEAYRAAGINFTRTAQGFGLASFQVGAPVPRSGPERLMYEAAARQRAQQDRSLGLGSYAQGAGFGTIGSGGAPMFFAEGGSVPGQGNTDNVRAMLSPGEFVVNRVAAQMFLPMLQNINRIKTPQPMGAPSVTNNVNLGGLNFSPGMALTDETIDRVVIPRIRFLLRMGRLG